jgi:putative photosynthetic complex assembly protein
MSHTLLRASAPAVQRADSFPRWFLYAAGALVAFSLVSVAAVRLTGNGPDQRAKAGVVERHLRFADAADGSIVVSDARSGEPVATIRGEQGFVRGALRTLARERKARGVGSEQPFVLLARTEGGLTLYDPVSRQRVDLDAFGPTNAGHFARLLPQPSATNTTPSARSQP